ncbi:HCO3 transporter family-domain-containing protein [Gaertneriomyces semiglobifer]|nr:HCO3 transporter family-domain-containing protein [Gaertneriomyces semiglobifer]
MSSLKLPQMRPIKDVVNEVKARAPYYASDWTDGFKDKKVLASSIFIFFANIAPAITFAFYLDDRTKSVIGVVEVLLSSALSGLIYSILSGQPLIIIGVTGPVSIFIVTVQSLASSLKLSFLPFLSWTILWSALMHIILGVCGACTLVSIVTRFSCEIFGCLIAAVYLLNGGKEVVRGFQEGTFETGLLALMFAVGTLWLCMQLAMARHWLYLRAWMRGLIADYAIPISVTFATVLSVVITRIDHSGMDRLNVPGNKPFLTTTSGRSWLVDLGDISVGGVFAALISGLILTILFYFDHNVSSLLSQKPENNLVKPSAFNWDFVVVGIAMIPCAFLGIPICNGLIPQAPLHVRSLAKIRIRPNPLHPNRTIEVWERVSEQRVSNFAQSALTLVALVPPILRIVGAIPRSVLAGLFFAMGLASFVGNQFAQRTWLFFADPKVASAVFPQIRTVPFKDCAKLTVVQLVFLAATLAVTESDNAAALSFPVFIAALVPVRYFLLPKFFPPRVLDVLDAADGRDFGDVASEDEDGSEVELEVEMAAVEGGVAVKPNSTISSSASAGSEKMIQEIAVHVEDDFAQHPRRLSSGQDQLLKRT